MVKIKKIESLEQKVDELSANINKLSEKQNSQYTDIMMILKEIQDLMSKNIEDPLSDEELYKEAKDTVIEYQRASVSFLQRILHIGYTRANSLIDQLEENKVIGPADGSRPREILTGEEEY